MIFTNDGTLFSFIVSNLLKRDFLNLKSIFIDGLNFSMVFVGLKEYAAHITRDLGNNLHFIKIGSRRVLGSMNDMAFILKVYTKERWFTHSRFSGTDEIFKSSTI